MGWIAIYRDGKVEREGDPGVGRPVQAGEDNLLSCIAQEDFGHTVAVDLSTGTIALDYEAPIDVADGQILIKTPGAIFSICEETNIIGDLFHVEHEFVAWYGPECKHCGKLDENNTGTLACPHCGKKRKQMVFEGKPVTVRNDIVTPVVWRPIWFTRNTNGVPTKVIGAQTTTPKIEGARNVKKLVMLYADGRVGID